MKNRVKKGDLVVLKSGGPVMTAKEGGSRGTEVCCQWFSGETLKSALFPIECLKSSIAPIEITPAQVRERLLNSPLVREALGQSGGGVEETAK